MRGKERPPAEIRRNRRPSGGVRVEDVAAAAGVSGATVSRALNKVPGVSADVRRRVEDAARAMGYVPHGAARALASRRSRTIGAVVPTLENPNFAIGVEALQHRLERGDYTLLLANSNYDPVQELRQVEILVGRGVDGIMLVGGAHLPELHDFLRAKAIPCVNTWVLSGADGAPSIGFDNKEAAMKVTNFLLDLGHRDIGVIAGLSRSNDRAAARVEGVRQALRSRGLTLAQERLIERPYRIVDGQMAMRELMAVRPRPTAIVCGNDILAFGAMIECQHQGIGVPSDVSIVGFDDLDFAAQLIPPLTTVRVSADEIGRRAAEYLLAAVSNEFSSPLPVPEIEVSLIVRGSTAPPPNK